MKIDLSPASISRRLNAVNDMRRLCLSLAGSSAGKEIMQKCSANPTVRRTTRSLAETPDLPRE